MSRGEIKQGNRYVVNKDLDGNSLDLPEKGTEVMIKKGTIVKVILPIISLRDFVGIEYFFNNLKKASEVDIPRDSLVPLNFKSLITLVIPHAIASIKLKKK